VARAKLEFIFENQGSSWIFHGLRLDFIEGQGANCKIDGDFPAWNFFSMGKYGGLGPPSMTVGGAGPRWTTDRASVVAHRSSA
jgi:hypothetical protein